MMQLPGYLHSYSYDGILIDSEHTRYLVRALLFFFFFCFLFRIPPRSIRFAQSRRLSVSRLAQNEGKKKKKKKVGMIFRSADSINRGSWGGCEEGWLRVFFSTRRSYRARRYRWGSIDRPGSHSRNANDEVLSSSMGPDFFFFLRCVALLSGPGKRVHTGSSLTITRCFFLLSDRETDRRTLDNKIPYRTHRQVVTC